MRDVKPGRWQMRNGRTVTVEDRKGHWLHPWRGSDNNGVRYSWGDCGEWYHASYPSGFDLVEYLGPIEQTGGEP